MSVYRRGKIWWVRFEIDGQEIRRSARTTSRTAAVAYEKELREEAARIARGGRPRHTYREAMERFLTEYLPTLKPEAARRYLSSARMLHGHFQGLYLDQIDSRTIKSFISARRSAGRISVDKDGNRRRIGDLDGATIKRDLACLGSMLTRAVEWDMIEQNPLHSIKNLGLREAAPRLRYLTREEYPKLLSNAAPHLRSVIILAVETGMRKEELLSLTWRQVDIKRRQAILTDTKSRKPRVVPLSPEASAQISAQTRHITAPWVFHEDGARFGTIRTGFMNACRRAGIDRLTFHDLRHTFASWAVQGLHSWQEVPMDLYRLSKWLGHSTTRMTERYAHLETDDLHGAIKSESAQNMAQQTRIARGEAS